MLTPYDWQEAIGHRASYVENKLAQGSPVLAISCVEGILLLTFRRNARKVFEIYDRLAFASIGQQSDVESLRVAAVDFAHQEGFNRSEQDVTIQRVVTALSSPVKKAFGDFQTAPFVARSLFAEVGAKPEQDSFVVLDYDGDFSTRRKFGYVAGTEETSKEIEPKLAELAEGSPSVKKADKALRRIWEEANPEEGLTAEIVLLDRSESRENRFRILEGAEDT